MKKLLLCCMTILLCCGMMSVAAEDQQISLAIGVVEMSDVLFGLPPTNIEAGINYRGFSLLPEKEATLKILLGGVRSSYTLWTDDDGAPISFGDIDDDFQDFAVWRGDISARLTQQLFGDVYAYGELSSHWYNPTENVGGTSSRILTGSIDPSVYPDADGGLTQVAKAGLQYDAATGGSVPSGLFVDVSFAAAPLFLANGLMGKSDFYQANGTILMYKPMYTLPMEGSDRNFWLSIYAADRIQGDYVFGSAVPQVFQEAPALGTKVRGFEKNSRGVAFTAVNNFEIRFVGPQLFISDIVFAYPRAELYVDAGYGTGNYYNTDIAFNDYNSDNFIASTGAEVAVDFFNFFDVGYRYNFVLAGENISERSHYGELLFALQF